MANNSEGISTKVGVKGDKEYKSALQQISRQLTVLNTDMKASQSAFGNQAETMDGMHDRLEKLNEIYEVQSKKVELIREQLEKAKEEYGENSKQADSLQIALNKATVQMNETRNKIGDTEQGLQTLADAQAVAGDATDGTNMTLKEAQEVLKGAATASKDAAEGSEEAGDAAGDLGDAADDAADGAGSLSDVLKDAGDAGKGFADGVSSVLDVLGQIGGAVADALGQASVVPKVAGKMWTVEFDYLSMNDVMKVLKEMNLSPSAQNFGENCSLTVRVRLSEEESFKKKLDSFAKLKEI